jgi:hypothetical protein
MTWANTTGMLTLGHVELCRFLQEYLSVMVSKATRAGLGRARISPLASRRRVMVRPVGNGRWLTILVAGFGAIGATIGTACRVDDSATTRDAGRSPQDAGRAKADTFCQSLGSTATLCTDFDDSPDATAGFTDYVPEQESDAVFTVTTDAPRSPPYALLIEPGRADNHSALLRQENFTPGGVTRVEVAFDLKLTRAVPSYLEPIRLTFSNNGDDQYLHVKLAFEPPSVVLHYDSKFSDGGTTAGETALGEMPDLTSWTRFTMSLNLDTREAALANDRGFTKSVSDLPTAPMGRANVEHVIFGLGAIYIVNPPAPSPVPQIYFDNVTFALRP